MAFAFSFLQSILPMYFFLNFDRMPSLVTIFHCFVMIVFIYLLPATSFSSFFSGGGGGSSFCFCCCCCYFVFLDAVDCGLPKGVTNKKQ